MTHFYENDRKIVWFLMRVQKSLEMWFILISLNQNCIVIAIQYHATKKSAWFKAQSSQIQHIFTIEWMKFKILYYFPFYRWYNYDRRWCGHIPNSEGRKTIQVINSNSSRTEIQMEFIISKIVHSIHLQRSEQNTRDFYHRSSRTNATFDEKPLSTGGKGVCNRERRFASLIYPKCL